LQKSLHPYAIFDHKRQTVGRFLGISSFVLGPALSQLFIDLSTLSGMSFFGTFVISSGLIYIGLDWIFDNIFWKIGFIGKLFSIPNYSGQWSVIGKTIDDNGDVQHTWEGMITMVQKWDTISIQLKTSRSQSYSYTATTLKLPNDNWQISYSYSNKPNLDQFNTLNSHYGFCELVFDFDEAIATGTYFNSQGRRTNGNMTLKQIKEQ